MKIVIPMWLLIGVGVVAIVSVIFLAGIGAWAIYGIWGGAE